MRVIVAKTFVFLFLFKLLDISLFLALLPLDQRTVVQQGASNEGDLGPLYRGGMREDMVAFGDSRIRYQLDAGILKQTTGLSTYNFAWEATPFDQQFFTLEEYLDRNRRPRAVIFEADPLSLDPAFFKFQTLWFRPYAGYSARVADRIFTSVTEKYANRFVRCLAFRGRVLPILRSAFSSRPVSGNSPAGTVPILRGHPPRGLKLDFKSFHINEARKQGFRQLAELAAKNGFVLFLISTPEYRHDQRLNARDADAAYHFFESLAKAYKTTFYLNYARDARFINQDDLWFDAQHLNRDGMVPFSRIVGADIAARFGDGTNKILTR